MPHRHGDTYLHWRNDMTAEQNFLFNDMVQPLKGVAPWLGGKSQLAPRIIKMLNNTPHLTYIEPFSGMGGVFFRRTNKVNCEVINDYNAEIANLFRILQNHIDPFLELLTFHLNSRFIFNNLKEQNPQHMTDLQRAVRFYVMQRQGFGGKVEGVFGVSKDSSGRYNLATQRDELKAFHKRLSRVFIENLDFGDCIEKYDSEDALFYLDPPYYFCEKDYGKALFVRADFERLRDLLKNIKGKFILSLNDVPEVREIFKDFAIEAVTLTYTIASAGATDAKEVIITG